MFRTSRTKPRIRKRNLIFVAAAASTVGLGLALGSAFGGQSSPAPIAYTPTIGHTSSLRGADTPGKIISAIVAMAGAHDISRAELAAPPPASGAPSGTYLHFTVDAPAADQRADRGEWEAAVLAGAVADAFVSHGFPRIVGATVDVRLADGKVVPNVSGGMGDVVPGQSFSDASDNAIASEVRSKLPAFGLTPVSISILHADQPAPAVVAKTSNPTAAAANAEATVISLFGRQPPHYEGYYLEVEDSSGNPVYIASASFRSGIGGTWFRDSVRSSFSIPHGSRRAP
jgi:hypothetical protein